MKLLILLSTAIALTACDSSKSNHDNSPVQAQSEYRMQSGTPAVTGKWSLTNAPKKGMSVELTFNENGTFRMYGVENVYDPASRTHEESGNWTMNGENIYLSTPGESEVGVMEILSLDANSLVIHLKDEPNNEIMYFSRQH